jgi:asparaginyl-tRNA synthetase
MSWLRIAEALKAPVGTRLTIRGWVRTRRDSKADGGLSFIAVHDGTCFDAIQVVARATLPNYTDQVSHLTSGCAVEVDGILVASQGKGQAVEIEADPGNGGALRVVGWVDNPDEYPIAQKRHTFEYLREVAHLRPRTNTFGAIARMRHCLSMAVHRFFDQRGFYYVHTPIVTGSDCEGAGQMFRVSTLDLLRLPLKQNGQARPPREGEGPLKVHGDKLVATAQHAGASPQDAQAPLRGETEHPGAHGLAPKHMGHAMGHGAAAALPHDAAIDWSEDFFGKETHLTVSGQLNVECYCCALSRVYTFGPTFRAENSNTSRHLAEFWMIEPEMAFCDLQGNSEVAEDFIKFLIDAALTERGDDMKFFEERIEKGLIERLKHVLESPFRRLDYTEAVEILRRSGKNFEFPISWGSDLQSEHERYLTEEHFRQPVVLMNYPKQIKAFYMRVNEALPRGEGVPADAQTVAAMDVLVPKIGEIIGGSQREERLEMLDRRLEEMRLEKNDYWWYRDLRRYGTVPHAGFGLGFERLMLFITGMQNIRDVIPFPRAPKQCEF